MFSLLFSSQNQSQNCAIFFKSHFVNSIHLPNDCDLCGKNLDTSLLSRLEAEQQTARATMEWLIKTSSGFKRMQ